MFGRKSSSSPQAQEYRAAKKALRNDPVNTGRLGSVDIDSPAGRANLAAQERLINAEKAVKKNKRH